MNADNWLEYYETLSLGFNGDDLEKEAARIGALASFENLERLWKRHIAPATYRPDGIGLRQDCDESMERFAIISHGIMSDVLFAFGHLAKIRGHDFGPFHSNAHIVLILAGNALEKLKDLNDELAAIHQKAAGEHRYPWLRGKEWHQNWDGRWQRCLAYRNCLTHFGRHSIREIKGIPHVVSPEDLLDEQRPWSKQHHVGAANPKSLLSLQDLCEKVYGDSIGLLNDAYADAIAFLDSLRERKAYQALWGNREAGKSVLNGEQGAEGAQGAVRERQFHAPPACFSYKFTDDTTRLQKRPSA